MISEPVKHMPRTSAKSRTDAVAAAKLFDGGSGLRFLEDRNDLFFAVSGSLHGSWIGIPLSGPTINPALA